MYSGKAGDALTGGGGMVEQWSACLSGMQFSTRDQVLFTSFTVVRSWHFFLELMVLRKKMTVITLTVLSLITRTMTATFRAAVLRRIRQDGGSTGETAQMKSVHFHSAKHTKKSYELRYNFLELYQKYV